jgi:hypothetical protein
MRGAMPPFPNTPPWHGARLKRKHRDKITFYVFSLTALGEPENFSINITNIPAEVGIGYLSL